MDANQSDQDGSGRSQERESPMFVPQDNENSSPDGSEGSERSTHSPENQNSAGQEDSDRNPNEAIDPNLPVEVDNAIDQENDLEADSEEQDQEESEETDGESAEETGENEDNDEDGEDEDDADDPIRDGCTRTCKQTMANINERVRILNVRLNRKETSIKTKDNIIKKLRETIRLLEAQLRHNGLIPGEHDGRFGNPKEHPKTTNGTRSIIPTWPNMLRRYIAGSPDMTYHRVWKQSQRELNMPVNFSTTHPNIRFIARDPDELSDGSPGQSPPAVPLPVMKKSHKSFDGLPDDVLFNILEELLWFDGSLIHCLSRLDLYVAPTHFPGVQELGNNRTGIKGRFFISAEKTPVPLSLTYDTIDPNVVLAPLGVCRRWAWFGTHIFYARNTFAFSSLGEWERFCNGIGGARVQRIQNVELTWIGGKCLAFDTSKTDGKRMNMRTIPLTWFCETSSLKTLVIHLSEVSKDYIRRPYEPKESKLYMKGKTAGQPNARMTRALRCCHGMDYIYQLRGLYWLKVYDLDQTSFTLERCPVRDSSFVLDLQRVVTQDKVPSRAAKSSLNNLMRLFPRGGWEPSFKAFKLLKKIFNEETGYDTYENDLDFDATSSRGTLSPSPPPDGPDNEGCDDASNGPVPNDGGSDDASDASNGSGANFPEHGLATPPASTRRRIPRGATPAPTPVEILDSDEDEEGLSDGSEGEEHSEDTDDDQQTDDDGDASRDGPDSAVDDDDALSTSTEIENADFINMVPRARSEGGHVSHISDDLHQQIVSRFAKPIVIDDDDDDEVQEIPKPALRRSTQTPGMFVTPSPWEVGEASSNGRRTVDLTTNSGTSPPVRDRHRGTTDSSGLFVRQSYSETQESHAPVSRRESTQIDLTLLSDDEDESDDHRKAPHSDVSRDEGEKEGEDDNDAHTPVSMGQPRGIKRSRSIAAASEPADGHKRQMTGIRFVSEGH
ncbi:hypothetical protein VM1G_05194 [Cytospora mali]|uniref:Halomucin n=1 Tax=Cytospora mali TaxID=578113 RepID=A0A194W064_CYTMA|nr:hypothetical protein VM1G_05194 [Valsa mali]